MKSRAPAGAGPFPLFPIQNSSASILANIFTAFQISNKFGPTFHIFKKLKIWNRFFDF
jgi:hypothetical protein